jgi:hypothetical protein
MSDETKNTLTAEMIVNAATMSKGKHDEKDEYRHPGDIRNFLPPPSSSTKSTPRRRRVITSDSEDEELIGGEGPAMPDHQTARSASARNTESTTRSPTAAPNSPPVHVLSDDDCMYIAGVRNPHRNASHQQHHPPGNRQQRSTPVAAKAASKTATPRATQTTGTARARNKRSSSSRFVGEATEASSNDDHTSDFSSDCIELDTNGADLYRQAVSSLRNANNARNQLRAATTNCRVCAQFAAYLQHFL